MSVFALAFLFGIISALLRGYVLSVLWAWFVSAKFGLPILDMQTAVGLVLLTGLLTKQSMSRVAQCTDEEKTALNNPIVEIFLIPGVVLTFGWITKHFL